MSGGEREVVRCIQQSEKEEKRQQNGLQKRPRETQRVRNEKTSTQRVREAQRGGAERVQRALFQRFLHVSHRKFPAGRRKEEKRREKDLQKPPGEKCRVRERQVNRKIRNRRERGSAAGPNVHVKQRELQEIAGEREI